MAELRLEHAGDALILGLSGDWRLGNPLPSSGAIERELETGYPPERVGFDTRSLGGWDSALLTFLVDVGGICLKRHIRLEREGLPQGVRRLLGLASAVPEAKGVRREGVRLSLLARLGDKALTGGRSLLDTVAFVGEVTAGLVRMVTGKARFRLSDLWLTIEESGSQALPIVSLISLLVGLILAFVGSIQLKVFGAQIYVADLVGIAMVRAMGAIMTGIIMAGGPALHLRRK